MSSPPRDEELTADLTLPDETLLDHEMLFLSTLVMRRKLSTIFFFCALTYLTIPMITVPDENVFYSSNGNHQNRSNQLLRQEQEALCTNYLFFSCFFQGNYSIVVQGFSDDSENNMLMCLNFTMVVKQDAF